MKAKFEEYTLGIYTLNLFSMLKVCMIFFVVLLNILGMEQFSRVITKGDIAKFEVYSDIVNGKYIDGEEVSELRKQEGVQEIYCQRLCGELRCMSDKKNKYRANLTVVNDSLMEKMMESNNITGLDVRNEEIAIVFSFDDKKYQCSTITIKYTGKLSYGKATAISVNKILYDADQTSLLGGFLFSPSERADLIINEKLAQRIAAELGDENILNSYTDVLVDCNSLFVKDKLQALLKDVSVIELESNSLLQDQFIRNVGTVVKGILVLIALVCFYIICNIVHTNITTGEEETGVEKTAGEINDTGKELMRMAGRTFLQACKVAVPVSLAVNFFFRYNKFKLVVTGYWAGALVMLGGFFIITSIAVKRTVQKLKR